MRKNNIYIVDANGEHQITTDGEVNKIINGLPDWVNEEEFSFNNALAWGADSKSLSWIKYDESSVKTYSLQIFKGENPERKITQIIPDYTVTSILRPVRRIPKSQHGVMISLPARQ